MASIEEAIETAVLSRAAGLAGLTGLPIAWPNIAFQPPKDGQGRPLPYLAVHHLPNVNQRLFINSATHRRPGLLQVDVVVPLDAGASIATRIAGQVVSHFPTDLSMPGDGLWLKVYKAPDVASGMKDEPYWRVPVTISYELYR